MQRNIVCNESGQGSLWITPRPRPPHPPGPFIWWGVMVGPGQQRAGECCLTEDNYQLCIITCVAGHRGHRQGWKLGTMRVTKWSWAIWWMSWRIQQVYKCTPRTQICVINSVQRLNHVCTIYLLQSTILPQVPRIVQVWRQVSRVTWWNMTTNFTQTQVNDMNSSTVQRCPVPRLQTIWSTVQQNYWIAFQSSLTCHMLHVTITSEVAGFA